MADEQQLLGQKNDPTGSPVAPYGHGNGGLFNQRGIGPDIFNAVQLPLAGLLSIIPVVNGGIDSNDEFGGEDISRDTLLTGVTKGAADDFSNQPTASCADGAEGGLMKTGTIVNSYGRFRFSTRELDIVRASRRQDTCDPLTLRWLGQPAFQGFGLSTTMPSQGNALANELQRRLYESMTSAIRMFSKRVWIGNPANNVGERRDIMGMNLHINSGNKIDAVSGQVITAANSTILPFGFDLVNSTATSGVRDIVRYIETMFLNLEWKDRQDGLGPVERVLVLRPELWDEVTAIWPIRQYQDALTQIVAFTNGRVVVNANDAYEMRNTYRNNLVLPIRGKLVRVIVDDTIPELDVNTSANLVAGQYASDIYAVPLTVLGGIPVLFFDGFQYNNAQISSIASLFNTGAFFTTSDGGYYFWSWNFKNGCLKVNWEFQPRLRLKTPQLAGRITNVKYQPLLHLSSFDPDSAYFVDGGATAYPAGPNLYTSWSTTTPVIVGG
jgi:hypothetical protein